MLRSILLITLVFFSVFNAFANNNDNVRHVIDADSTTFEYFSNDERSNSIEQIRKLKSHEWIPASSFNSYGLVNRNYWLHLTVQVPSKFSTSDGLYLEIANPIIDYLEVYLFKGGQSRKYLAGNIVETSKRPIETPIFYFPLPNNESQTLEIYIQYRDEAASALPLAITNSKESLETVSNHGILIGVVLGLIISLLMGALIVYNYEKTSFIQYYIGLVIFGALSVLNSEGVSSIYIWPSFPWLQNLISPIILLLTLWCSIQLTRCLITKLLANYYIIENIFLWLSRAVLIITLVLFALPSFIAIITSIIIVCISLIIILSTLTILTVKSKTVPILLLVTWATFIVSFAIKAVHLSGILPLHLDLLTSATFVYCLQFLLWGALILNQFIKDKEESIVNANNVIEELTEKSAAAEALILTSEQEQLDMEALVGDRTFELNVTLRELQETNKKLQEQATNDALTGVKNRKFFDERLKAEYRLSRRQHTPISLLILDADKFKLVNDNHGHLAGDKVLIDISKIASKALKRPNDYVCRFGGEEFAILLSNTDEKGAVKIAELIRNNIGDKLIKTDNVELKVTVSVGVSTLMIDHTTSDSQLFDQADKALYFAKESGRNNVKTFTQLQFSKDK